MKTVKDVELSPCNEVVSRYSVHKRGREVRPLAFCRKVSGKSP